MNKFRWFAILFTVAIALTVACCKGKSGSSSASSGKFPDTLRVGTLYSPTSYFIYREEKMGYDYELINNFCESKGMAMDLVVAPNLSTLLAMVKNGEIDVAAYEIPLTAEYKNKIIPCGPENISHQVLVQPKSVDSLITDVTQLVGKEIYVEKDSKYQHRLANLNDELGGGITIHTVDIDTLITEDMIEMVSSGKIPLTVIDSDVAQINKTYYNALDISLEISFPQRASWGVSPRMSWLADSIDSWIAGNAPKDEQENLMKRYFELSKGGYNYQIDLSKGAMSKYDNLFKKYAKEIDWDWRLLASQSFAESNFNPNARSWAGARGLMQIMPRTAKGYGLSAKAMNNPEASIKTSVKILKDLDKWLSKHVSDPEERKKFVLAAYNVGIAHVYDGIALAKKYGKDPTKWKDNVEQMILLKSDAKYYNDPVVKFGYARGKEPVGYVKKILNVYDQARKQIPA